MPWNMTNYPNSLKNFDETLRKKIIDIANALLAKGYDEDHAIPIAIDQGKDWYASSPKAEISDFAQEPDPSINDEHNTEGVNSKLLDNDVAVFYEDEVWKVKTINAKRVTDSFDTKKEALQRAKEIANNRDSNVIKFTKGGKKQSK